MKGVVLMGTASKTVRTICEIGIFAAIGFVLDELQGIIFKGVFINGGSIGFAMIAVLIIGYRRGWLPALLTGLIMGLFDIATSAYIIHPAQLFLDYILPYALVAIGCLCKYPYEKAHTRGEQILWLVLGAVIGGTAKLISHYLAGVLFWADPQYFAWGLTWMNPYSYCLLYNFAFIGPSIVITAALLVALYLRAPMVLTAKQRKKKSDKDENDEEEREEKKQLTPLPYVIALGVAALGCFVYFLILYIKSFKNNSEGGVIDYEFDPNSMAVVVLSFFFIILTIVSLVQLKKQKFNLIVHSQIAFLLVSLSFIYCIARLIRMYVKHNDPTIYWIWFGVGLATVVLYLVLTLILTIRRKKEIAEAKALEEKRLNESNRWR